MYQHTIYCDTMSEKPTQEVYLVCKQRLPCCLSVSPPYADVGRISARCWIENQVQNIPEQKPTLSKVEIVKCANSFDNFSIPSHFTPSRRLVIACLSYSIHYVKQNIISLNWILDSTNWTQFCIKGYWSGSRIFRLICLKLDTGNPLLRIHCILLSQAIVWLYPTQWV